MYTFYDESAKLMSNFGHEPPERVSVRYKNENE